MMLQEKGNKEIKRKGRYISAVKVHYFSTTNNFEISFQNVTQPEWPMEELYPYVIPKRIKWKSSYEYTTGSRINLTNHNYGYIKMDYNFFGRVLQ